MHDTRFFDWNMLITAKIYNREPEFQIKIKMIGKTKLLKFGIPYIVSLVSRQIVTYNLLVTLTLFVLDFV